MGFAKIGLFEKIQRVLNRLAKLVFHKRELDSWSIEYLRYAQEDSVRVEKEIYPEAKIQFSPPLGEISHYFMGRHIISLKNALVDNLTGRIFIRDRFNSDRWRQIEEATEWPTESNFFPVSLPNIRFVDRLDKAKLGINGIGYYHLLTHALPRVMHLRDIEVPELLWGKMGETALKVRSFLEPSTNTVTTARWVFVNELFLVTTGNDVGYLHPSDAKLIRQFSKSNKSKSRSNLKVYVSRRKSRRSLHIEAVLEDILWKKGFEIVYAEELSLREQEDLFSRSNVVMGIHGAGLNNAIFGDSVHLIEIMPSSRLNRCYEWQSMVLKHRYSRVLVDKKSDQGEIINSILDLLND